MDNPDSVWCMYAVRDTRTRTHAQTHAHTHTRTHTISNALQTTNSDPHRSTRQSHHQAAAVVVAGRALRIGRRRDGEAWRRVVISDRIKRLLLPACERRVDRAGQDKAERLVALEQRLAHDGNGDALCGLAGRKRERAAGGGVVGRRRGGAVGRGVADGDGLALLVPLERFGRAALCTAWCTSSC
jgi:hypothetical protein